MITFFEMWGARKKRYTLALQVSEHDGDVQITVHEGDLKGKGIATCRLSRDFDMESMKALFDSAILYRKGWLARRAK